MCFCLARVIVIGTRGYLKCVDRYSCLLEPSHEAMNNIARATKYLLKRVLYWFRWRPCQKPYNAHFDVNVALTQYTLRTLIVDFQCSDSKDSRIMCLHIQNIDMNLPDAKHCSFTGFFFNAFHQNLTNFETFSYGCLVRRIAFIYTYFSKMRVC